MNETTQNMALFSNFLLLPINLLVAKDTNG